MLFSPDVLIAQRHPAMDCEALLSPDGVKPLGRFAGQGTADTGRQKYRKALFGVHNCKELSPADHAWEVLCASGRDSSLLGVVIFAAGIRV